MKIPQISVFLENRPGQLQAVCRTLKDAGINILTLSLSDTERFGILHLIVRDWQKGRDALEKAGWIVRVNEMLAIEVEDRPGGLLDILEVLSRAQVNVEYMYAFTLRRSDKAVLFFRLDQTDRAIEALKAAKISVVGGVELFGAAE